MRENKKQIAKGFTIAQEINSRDFSDFAKRRLQYDAESKTGTDNKNN